MTYSLVIVESPAKCKKIESFLGAGYKCMASFGHIRSLPDLKCIDIKNNFRPTFTITDSKRQQISKLRTAIKNASEVILAADDDREGEAIAWHICDLFHLPVDTTKRIIFHEITETALQRAIRETTTLNMNVVYAQQARQILDLIVGYKLSPVLWQKISHTTKAGLSAGRCQTPALRLVYDNQKLIDASPGKKVYQTTGYFTSKNIAFALNYNHDSEESITDFLEESVDYTHKYDYGNPRNVTKQPPMPYTTSTLQQSASNELRFSPKTTMQLCQVLYEGGYITYMRTDSKTYSKDFVDIAFRLITSMFGKEYISTDVSKLTERKEDKPTKGKKKMKKGGKKSEKESEVSAQEAHEAIRPTKIDLKTLPEKVGKREARLYALIWRNTMESCMSPATYKGITAIISAPSSHQYRYSTEQVIFPGWKAVAGYEKENKDYSFIQTLKKGSDIDYKKITSNVSLKELKTHYTEAKLVQLLEEKGIGRPSTFSALIDKIQERNYVKKTNITGKKIKCVDFELEADELAEIETERTFGNEKNKLVIQPLGILVIEFLIQNYNELFEYDYTKHMEDSLDHIARGDKIWHSLCQECYTQIKELSECLDITERISIKLDDRHTYMIGKYGPVIKVTNGKKTEFKGVKDDIDLDIEKLKKGLYRLEDIVYVPDEDGDKSSSIPDVIGIHDNEKIFLKNGKYGPYIRYKGENISAGKYANETITLENAIQLIQEKQGQSSIIRVIDDCTSVRKGKFGDYIFHKQPTWKKPKFIKLIEFIKANGRDSYKTCDVDILKKWLREVHSIKQL